MKVQMTKYVFFMCMSPLCKDLLRMYLPSYAFHLQVYITLYDSFMLPSFLRVIFCIGFLVLCPVCVNVPSVCMFVTCVFSFMYFTYPLHVYVRSVCIFLMDFPSVCFPLQVMFFCIVVLLRECSLRGRAAPCVCPSIRMYIYSLRVHVPLYICSFMFMSFYVFVTPDIHILVCTFYRAFRTLYGVYVNSIREHSTVCTLHYVYTSSFVHSTVCINATL